MAEQLPLNYSPNPSGGIVEGSANAQVLAALARPHWPSGRLAVIGSACSGKTTIARRLLHAGAAALGTAQGTQKLISGTQAPMLIIDNFARFMAEDGAEEAFFHLLNRTEETGQKIVVFTRIPLDQLTIKLADLRSRLGTFESFTIDEPDDAMMVQLLAKSFEARGVLVKADVLSYLAKRSERSYEAIFRTVEALDEAALRDNGKISKSRIKEFLEQNDSENGNQVAP